MAILQIFLEEGLNIDASSGFECRRAMAAGFKPNMMSLSSQARVRSWTFFRHVLSWQRTVTKLRRPEPTKLGADF